MLTGISGLGLLGADLAFGLELCGNSPSTGLLIYCSSPGQRISKSKGSCSLILLSSRDGGGGGPYSRLVSSPASWSSKLALRSCLISSCLVVASVLGGPTHLQVNQWYRPLFLLLWSYSSIVCLSRSTISSRVSSAAGGVG